MDTGLTPLLIDAKKEYVGQLTDVLAPYVLNRFVNLFMAARRAAPKTPILAFQKALRDIPSWNAGTIVEYTQEIQSKYTFLGDLIAACFVAYVKILSSVKLHQQKPNIRLKLPSNDAFVHKVYVHAAREFYTTPALINADRATKVAVVKMAVETSVRDMLPIEDILKAYLGNTVDASDNSMLPGELTEADTLGADPPPPTPPSLGFGMGMLPPTAVPAAVPTAVPAAVPAAAAAPASSPPTQQAPAPLPPAADLPLFASEQADSTSDSEEPDDYPKLISLGAKQPSQQHHGASHRAVPPPQQHHGADLFSDADDDEF